MWNSQKRLGDKGQVSKFRRDILGIRGLAITLVVANHFKVPGFDFGFVGVDIFFVVSGYLIVGLMYEEFLKNGKSLGGYGWISISSFFQRRARRILPAASVVLFVVYLVNSLISDSNFKLQTNYDILWALIFVSNINFAQRQTDYFSTADMPSPVLHYWSLGVEEQFYILMPFFFMAVSNWHGFTIAGQRVAARMRIFIFMALISVASLSVSILSFGSGGNQDYYSTFLRIWEFGLGALAALTLPVISNRLKIYLLLIRRICYATLAISLLLITERNLGYMLIVPTASIATIMYINGQFKFGLVYERLITNRLLTYFGKISFSMYLWHWPILIYAEYFFQEITWLSKILLFLLMLVLSTMSERYIERPFLRVGFMGEFHLSPLIKSRRVMAGVLLTLTSGLFIATYQPILSSYFQDIQAQRQAPFWTPPSIAEPTKDETAVTSPSPRLPTATKNDEPKYMGIFGDSTNQCCSATGAFWPRLVSKHFGMTFADYSKPATTYLNDGVGSNGCENSKDCPSVIGQLAQSSGKSFDVIAISSGIGDCQVAQKNSESLEASLYTIFRNFKIKFPNAYVFTMGLTYSINSEQEKCLSAVNPIIYRAAVASGVTFLDNTPWLKNAEGKFTRDGAHLNDKGHLLIANKVIQSLKNAQI